MNAARLLAFLALATALVGNPARGQSFDDAYARIKPAQPTQSGDKIEVVEIFWYGCSHCFRFEPYVEAWKQGMPEDVAFRRVPAAMNKGWLVHARAFYAAERMGVLEQLHTPLFRALHVARRKISDRKSLLRFVDENGIDRKEFARHYDSNETDVKLKQAFLLARNARVTGVPSLIVNGKYLVTSAAGSFQRMLETVDHLADVERRR